MSEEEQAALELFRAQEKVKGLARRQFTKGNCPLATYGEGHYNNAQSLWGTGCVWWNCEMCGEEFSI